MVEAYRAHLRPPNLLDPIRRRGRAPSKRRMSTLWSRDRLIDDRGYPLTIGVLTYENPKKKKLSVFRYIGTKGRDSEKIIEGYRYLASKHRNRDINYYVKNIRDDHFHEVGEIFVPCFNILIGVVPDQASVASALLAQR